MEVEQIPTLGVRILHRLLDIEQEAGEVLAQPHVAQDEEHLLLQDRVADLRFDVAPGRIPGRVSALAPIVGVVEAEAPASDVVGPNDTVTIPRGSEKTDWEVELGIVIGTRAAYLDSVDEAAAHIAGYVVANDVSERAFQMEVSGGQWSKGKIAFGFNPTGPWLVPALFGPQWHDAGMIAPMLVPLALPFVINPFVLALLAARGRIKWQRHLALLDLATTIAVTWATVSHGLKWLALAYSLRAVMLIPLQIHLVNRVAGIGMLDHARALAKPVAAAAVMGVVAALSFYVVDPAGLLTIMALCGIAALIYAAIVAAILPQYRKAALSFVRV